MKARLSEQKEGHVQSVHSVLRVILDDLIGNEERFVRVRGAEAI